MSALRHTGTRVPRCLRGAFSAADVGQAAHGLRPKAGTAPPNAPPAPRWKPNFARKMNLPSRLLDDAVEAFAGLPGIGRKTALRLVLHLLRRPEEEVSAFGEAVARMRREIRFCRVCRNASDADTCAVCANAARNNGIVCVVENVRDLLAIEQTGQFSGRYHVLGGVISPLDGVGPEQLAIEALDARARNGEIREALMALPPTIEGDTTIHYLARRLERHGVPVTLLARGVSFGGDLEYVDELTLARSIATRRPYEDQAAGGPTP
jgi:recombination protein RecR